MEFALEYLPKVGASQACPLTKKQTSIGTHKCDIRLRKTDALPEKQRYIIEINKDKASLLFKCGQPVICNGASCDRDMMLKNGDVIEFADKRFRLVRKKASQAAMSRHSINCKAPATTSKIPVAAARSVRRRSLTPRLARTERKEDLRKTCWTNSSHKRRLNDSWESRQSAPTRDSLRKMLFLKNPEKPMNPEVEMKKRRASTLSPDTLKKRSKFNPKTPNNANKPPLGDLTNTSDLDLFASSSGQSVNDLETPEKSNGLWNKSVDNVASSVSLTEDNNSTPEEMSDVSLISYSFTDDDSPSARKSLSLVSSTPLKSRASKKIDVEIPHQKTPEVVFKTPKNLSARKRGKSATKRSLSTSSQSSDLIDLTTPKGTPAGQKQMSVSSNGSAMKRSLRIASRNNSISSTSSMCDFNEEPIQGSTMAETSMKSVGKSSEDSFRTVDDSVSRRSLRSAQKLEVVAEKIRSSSEDSFVSTNSTRKSPRSLNVSAMDVGVSDSPSPPFDTEWKLEESCSSSVSRSSRISRQPNAEETAIANNSTLDNSSSSTRKSIAEASTKNQSAMEASINGNATAVLDAKESIRSSRHTEGASINKDSTLPASDLDSNQSRRSACKRNKTIAETSAKSGSAMETSALYLYESSKSGTSFNNQSTLSLYDLNQSKRSTRKSDRRAAQTSAKNSSVMETSPLELDPSSRSCSNRFTEHSVTNKSHLQESALDITRSRRSDRKSNKTIAETSAKSGSAMESSALNLYESRKSGTSFNNPSTLSSSASNQSRRSARKSATETSAKNSFLMETFALDLDQSRSRSNTFTELSVTNKSHLQESALDTTRSRRTGRKGSSFIAETSSIDSSILEDSALDWNQSRRSARRSNVPVEQFHVYDHDYAKLALSMEKSMERSRRSSASIQNVSTATLTPASTKQYAELHPMIECNVVIDPQSVAKSAQANTTCLIESYKKSRRNSSLLEVVTFADDTPPAKTRRNEQTFDLSGVECLFKTPMSVQKDNRYETTARKSASVSGGKNLYATPMKSPRNDLTNVSGVKQMLKSATKAQKSPRNDLTDVRGVKQLLGSGHKAQRSPKNDLTDVRGVKQLLGSGHKAQRSPKNDLTRILGVKQLYASPRPVQKSPRNDLTDVRGVKQLYATRRSVRTPKNDLSDVSGLKELFNDFAKSAAEATSTPLQNEKKAATKSRRQKTAESEPSVAETKARRNRKAETAVVEESTDAEMPSRTRGNKRKNSSPLKEEHEETGTGRSRRNRRPATPTVVAEASVETDPTKTRTTRRNKRKSSPIKEEVALKRRRGVKQQDEGQIEDTTPVVVVEKRATRRNNNNIEVAIPVEVNKTPVKKTTRRGKQKKNDDEDKVQIAEEKRTTRRGRKNNQQDEETLQNVEEKPKPRQARNKKSVDEEPAEEARPTRAKTTRNAKKGAAKTQEKAEETADKQPDEEEEMPRMRKPRAKNAVVENTAPLAEEAPSVRQTRGRKRVLETPAVEVVEPVVETRTTRRNKTVAFASPALDSVGNGRPRRKRN